MLHWCQPILRIGEIGTLTYVIVYTSIVPYIKYINCLFVLLQTHCIGLIIRQKQKLDKLIESCKQ